MADEYLDQELAKTLGYALWRALDSKTQEDVLDLLQSDELVGSKQGGISVTAVLAKNDLLIHYTD